MNKQIDIKSLLIGVLMAVCIVLVMGAGRSSGPMPYGRFHLVTGESTTYIIDTTTGKVWTNRDEGFRAPKIQHNTTVEKEDR